jgi:hypothetical protein
MKRMFFVVVLVLLAHISLFAQSNDPVEKESLKGLSGVYVFLNLSDQTQIRTDVEIRLRKAGIRVLTIEEAKELARRPALEINLTT